MNIPEHIDLIAALAQEVGACTVRLEICRVRGDQLSTVRRALAALNHARGALADQKLRTMRAIALELNKE